MELTQIVLLLIIALLFSLFLVWQIIKNGYRKTVIDLIVLAEKNIKDNQEKFNSVVSGIIVKLPIPFNFIPVSFVESFVQKVFDEVKNALDYQKGE